MRVRPPRRENQREMLTFFKETHIDFMGKRRVFYAISIAITMIGVISFILHGGFRLGVDFAGGRLIEVRLSQPMSIDAVRAAVDAAGFTGAEIQGVRGTTNVLIRIPEVVEKQRGGEQSASSPIMSALKERTPGLAVELLREETVGAKIGKEIRGQAFWAIIVSLGLLVVYVGFRFELRFGIGAVIAVAHDVVMVLTLFSLFNKEITMSVVAALLTLAGYSINDTIVVFDRVREQLVRLRREPFANVLNISVNQTLSRTMITGLTTLFTAGMLLFMGGEVIRDFALAIFFGIIVGTYSSVFIASALALDLRRAAEAKGGGA